MPYKPYGAAENLIYDKSNEVVISGPAGTGKSLACLWKLYAIACKYPGCRLLVIRKTRASLTESILVTWESHVMGQENPLVSGASRQYRHSYKFPNGSEIVVGGLDNADRIMSTEYDIIYVAESTELREDEWEKLATRLRHGKVPYQQMIADCNPDAPTHWLKQRCDDGAAKMWESRHEDNPTLYDHESKEYTAHGIAYIDRLEALTGVRLERLRYGRWVAAEGVVYDGWDARVHLIDRFEVPPGWRRIRAIDFGYTNPFVCGWFAIDADGRMYLYRYTYRTQTLVEDHAREIKELSRGENIAATICDHDAEGNATLRRYGVPTTNAKKSINTGLEAVAKRLRVAGDGRPRLYVLRDSLVNADSDLLMSKRPYMVEQEFDCYSWPKTVDGKPVKELPVDKDNHGLDMIRYAAMHLESATAVRPLVLDYVRESRRDMLRRV